MKFFMVSAAVAVASMITMMEVARARDERAVIPGSGYATVYRDPGMRGPAVAVQRAEPRFEIAFPIRSINVQSGLWQLCGERNFRGQCAVFDSSQRNLTNRLPNNGFIRSIRPIRFTGPGPGPGPGPGYPNPGFPGGGNPGPSLRGSTAEFFTQPREGGQRVLACLRGSASAACIQASANAFCQRRGWTRAQHQRGETQRGRVYLMDVLCTRT